MPSAPSRRKISLCTPTVRKLLCAASLLSAPTAPRPYPTAPARTRGRTRVRTPVPRERRAGLSDAGGPRPAQAIAFEAGAGTKSTISPPRHQVHQEASKREAPYPVFEQGRVEVHQEAKAPTGKSEIGDDLRLDRLDLYDHRLLDEKIDSVSDLKGDALVPKWERDLTS